jgi:hypothetical protein
MKTLEKIAFVLALSLFIASCSDDADEKNALPKLSVTDVTFAEGDVMIVTVSADKELTKGVTFSYRTEHISTSDSDFLPVKTLFGNMQPLEKEFKIAIDLRQDELTEQDETFKIILFNPVDAVIADGEAVGTITNTEVAVTNTFFMKAKIGSLQWTATIGGFFGAAFIGNTFAGYNGDTQLSVVLYNDPTGPKTYGLEELGATSDANVSIYYSPTFFSSNMLGPVFNGQPGGQFIITKYDLVNNVAEGTFTFTGKNPDTGALIQVTEGSFKVPIE